jgi:hypothetical protein
MGTCGGNKRGDRGVGGREGGGVNFALVWNLKRFIHDHKNRIFFIPLNSYNV